jgi:hypothetical protein
MVFGDGSALELATVTEDTASRLVAALTMAVCVAGGWGQSR